MFFFYLVALVGLEPTLLAELDFESSASTNSATGPEGARKLMQLSLLQPFLPGVRCGLPCELAFSQVLLVFHFSFQWLF